MPQVYEIERKWLVNTIPPEIDLEKCDPKLITQGYLIDESGKLIRYRQKGSKFYKTHKLPTDHPAMRTEDEAEISEEEFQAKWPQTDRRRIIKTRYHIAYEGYTIELDVFQGDNLGKMMAEVEFESTDESDAFVPPSWLGQEVTEDIRYTNSEIAENGFPENG